LLFLYVSATNLIQHSYPTRRSSDLRFFQPKSGTDLVWLSAVTKYIIDQGWQNQAFIDEWVNDFEEYKQSLEKFTLEYAENITGIDRKSTRLNSSHVSISCAVFCLKK